MHRRTFVLGSCAVLFAGQVFAQATVASVQPAAVRPGETTRLTLAGKGLAGGVRVATRTPGASVRVEKAEEGQALVDLTLPVDCPLGPAGLWVATADGPTDPFVLLVDDLPAVADNGGNHAAATAQAVPALCAVDGTSDGASSDFYRVTAEAGQRVAFEVHTQALRSAMDPVVRLLDAGGRPLRLADDDAVGPECRFSHTFEVAGDYLIEIRDNRFAAGGAYHLRIGDFPVVRHAFPLAVQRGATANVTFGGEDGTAAEAVQIAVPADSAAGSVNAAARLPSGKSSAWATVVVSDTQQFVEAAEATAQPLSLPVGISGRLDEPKQRDSYLLAGVKGQTVRIGSRTRSLGCATALQMQLFNPAGAKVAETAITEADEWGFDYAFPEDGTYRIEVRDLLGRGGPGLGYWIDCRPAGSVSIALKADAATKEKFPVEFETGCGVVDLQVARFGYDGELALSLSDETAPLRILNPVIPAGAAEVRVYVTATAEWKSESLAAVKLVARAPGNPAIACSTTALGLRRLKEPHVPFPGDWNDGVIAFGGVPKAEPFFTLEPAAAVELARPVRSHAAVLNLERLQAEFKAGATILGNALPAGWTVAAAAEGDAYKLTLARGAEAADEPASLPLLAVAEHNGRTRIETVQVPVSWIDPLTVALNGPDSLVAGQAAKFTVSLTRAGSDRQPVALTLKNLPAGVSGPAEAVTIPADQTAAEVELRVAAEAAVAESLSFGIDAATSYGGQAFSVSAASKPLRIVPAPTRLEVFPPAVTFDGNRSRQQLAIVGFDPGDSPRDWSREARIATSNPAVAEVVGTVIRPVGAGTAEVVVEVGPHRAVVPVSVTMPEGGRPIAFESEVLVALSKQGCNSGACHGSPSGKGGFRLSLRAFDKKLDELTLIREDFGRRTNPLDPEQSLLLIKPTMKVTHGGGMQLHKTDEAYPILRDWIAEGAKADPADAPRCVRLEIYPPQKRVSRLKDGGQQFVATAHFSDGARRDVTHLVAYESSNTSVATVDEYGRVTPLARGESVILVRFLEHIESVPLMFVDEVDGFQWTSPPENNYVDTLAYEKLRQLQYLPSETCGDDVFLRRVHLDVLGVLPTAEETRAFLDDPAADKRAKLIDRLLEREEYARFWALKWGDLLRMTVKTVGDEGVHKYHRWVEESIRTNMPYDRFARALLTGSGSTLANPPANFYRTATERDDCVETVSQVFLGARLQCAKCHNHPFERWTQDNYYGLGAFFQRVQRRKTQRPGEMFVYTADSGEVTQPRTGQVMQPWLPQVGTITPEADADRREAFADWLVSPENPYFARIEANRIWSQLFARGIVDPIDDFRDSNPPSNEKLLDALAKDFAGHGFDRKHLIRTILNSRTYQADYRTNPFNEGDTLYFSHQEPRLLGAEQLLDAVNQATGLGQQFGSLPAGTKATQLPAPDMVKVDFLKVFGQPERSTVCACERVDDSNLGMAIELFNGTTIHEKLRDANNRFRVAAAAGRPTDEIVREMYLAAVCRPPTEQELQTALAHIGQREDVASGLEDVCWALFNTDEFLFQH